nr:uncharacterized protein LOC111501983 isoform X1 [Leptinotarsa decemlineata]
MKIATLCVAIFLVATVSRTEGKPVPGFLGMLTNTLGMLGNAVNEAEDVAKKPIDEVVKMIHPSSKNKTETTTTATITTATTTPTQEETSEDKPTTKKLSIMGRAVKYCSDVVIQVMDPMIDVVSPGLRLTEFTETCMDKFSKTFDHVWGTIMGSL